MALRTFRPQLPPFARLAHVSTTLFSSVQLSRQLLCLGQIAL